MFYKRLCVKKARDHTVSDSLCKVIDSRAKC